MHGLELGGFSQIPNGEASLLATLSAIQILIMIGKFRCLFAGEDARAFVRNCVKFLSFNKCIDVFSLWEADGSWVGDSFGERDTRFIYAAFSILSLLFCNDLDDAAMQKLKLSIAFVQQCQNNDIDGGFGALPYAESHSGQVFCCVSCLSIAKQRFGIVQKIDDSLLKQWLAFRQDIETGGLNGRPQKLVDVCGESIFSRFAILGG